MQFLANVVREELGGGDSNDAEWHKPEDVLDLHFEGLKKEHAEFERQSTFRETLCSGQEASLQVGVVPACRRCSFKDDF